MPLCCSSRNNATFSLCGIPKCILIHVARPVLTNWDLNSRVVVSAQYYDQSRRYTILLPFDTITDSENTSIAVCDAWTRIDAIVILLSIKFGSFKGVAKCYVV